MYTWTKGHRESGGVRRSHARCVRSVVATHARGGEQARPQRAPFLVVWYNRRNRGNITFVSVTAREHIIGTTALTTNEEPGIDTFTKPNITRFRVNASNDVTYGELFIDFVIAIVVFTVAFFNTWRNVLQTA